MSYRATAYVRDVVRTSPLRPTARALALALAGYANAAGTCWPSEHELAAVLGLKPRAVRYALADVEASGLLAVDRISGRVNRYRFPIASPLTAVIHTEEVMHNPGTYVPQSDDETPARTQHDPGTYVPETPARTCLRNSQEQEENVPARPPEICDACGKPVYELGRWRHRACPPPARPGAITRAL